MSADRWTFLVIKGEHGEIRQFSLPHRRLRAGIVGAAAGLILVLAGLLWVSWEGSARLEATALRVENEALTQELDRLQGRVAVVEGSMSRIAEQNALVRNLAGLDPIDDEILQVGIGGPGGLKLESTPLFNVDRELGAQSFALSYDLSALERRANLLARSFDAAADSLQANYELFESTPSILPTSGWLSSRFARARMHPIHGESRPHKGVDISADRGTPILAAANGRVVRAGWVPGLGEMVEIDHGFGYRTRYGHASRLHVQAGQEVERGQLIAQVGSTGIATGPHLHYEVWLNGVAQNPLNYVIPADAP